MGTTATLHYQRLECHLGGDGYDLRPLAATWSFLTNPAETVAYPQCQSLAGEARANAAQALLTHSARRTAGVNAPVFDRTALSAAEIVGSAALITEAAGLRIVSRAR